MSDILSGISTMWNGVNVFGVGTLLLVAILIIILTMSMSKNSDKLLVGLISLMTFTFAGLISGVNRYTAIVIMILLAIFVIFINATGDSGE